MSEPRDELRDSLVRCNICHREQRVGFARSLRRGWPKCCRGYTMTLVSTSADIGAATTTALRLSAHQDNE